MNSYRPDMSPRRKKFVDLVSKVHLEIDNAVEDWLTATGKSKSELARRLEVNKAVLSRRLNGTSNMTLRTIADLAWALGREVDFSLRPAPDRLHNAQVWAMEDGARPWGQESASGNLPNVVQAYVVRTGVSR